MVYNLRSRDSHRKKFCQCDECGLQFFADKEVKMHAKSVHSARGRYFCKKCGIRFSLKSQKQAHKKRFHAFHCLNCRKIFYSKRLYESHEKNHLYNCGNSIEPIDNFKIKVEFTAQVESIASVSENLIEAKGASTSKVQNDIVPVEEKSKDDSGKSAPEPQAGSASSKVDIMANLRLCSSCGTNFLLPREKFREHKAYCKEYQRKKGVEKYYAKIAADAALAAPKKRSIDELSKEPVAHPELVEPQPTVSTAVVATTSKKRSSKPKKAQKEIFQNDVIANTGLTQTIESLPNVSSSSSSAVATNDKKRPSNLIVATKFPKKQKVQKEPFQNSVVDTVCDQIIERPPKVSSSTSLSTANKISALSLAIPSSSAVESVLTFEASHNVCIVPLVSSSHGQSSSALNRMNISLIRDTVKHRSYLCSFCPFTISNMQVMMTHFIRKHPFQVVEFTEVFMSKLKMEVNN